MEDLGKRFLLSSARILRDENLPKIREAVALLSDQELWQRGGSASNAVGNLLLHLAGNVRQHVIAGVGGVPDVRDRPREFAAEGGPGRKDLLDRLTQTVEEACAVFEGFDPALLSERRMIQDKEVPLLEDIYRVVEHFSYHTGQIIYAVKAMKDHRFPWYRHLDPKGN